MTNDDAIRATVAEIQAASYTWLHQVHTMGNQNAWTDRGVETIVSLSEKLKRIHESNSPSK